MHRLRANKRRKNKKQPLGNKKKLHNRVRKNNLMRFILKENLIQAHSKYKSKTRLNMMKKVLKPHQRLKLWRNKLNP